MTFMLDTDLCIYVINERDPRLQTKFNSHLGRLYVSSVSVAELEYGVQKSKARARNRRVLAEFLDYLNVVSFDAHAAAAYGYARAQLDESGMPVGPIDCFIAAHATSLDMTLVTNNDDEFHRFPGLRVENWLA